MKQYTVEELTSMLTSRKTPPMPVVIFRESFIVDAGPDEDPNLIEEVQTPFFARVFTIPERLKVQAAFDAARAQGKSEQSQLSIVVRLGACDADGKRLFNDQWQGNGEADENIMAIFNTTLVANGFRRSRTVLKKKPDGEVEVEKKELDTPVDTIGKNS